MTATEAGPGQQAPTAQHAFESAALESWRKCDAAIHEAQDARAKVLDKARANLDTATRTAYAEYAALLRDADRLYEEARLRAMDVREADIKAARQDFIEREEYERHALGPKAADGG